MYMAYEPRYRDGPHSTLARANVLCALGGNGRALTNFIRRDTPQRVAGGRGCARDGLQQK